jgi:hypothetical protein
MRHDKRRRVGRESRRSACENGVCERSVLGNGARRTNETAGRADLISSSAASASMFLEYMRYAATIVALRPACIKYNCQQAKGR